MTAYRSATVISDIHGMAPALEAVLAEESRNPSEVLIVAGDTAAGPLPNAVIDLLRQHQDRLVIVSGNGDRNIIEIRDGIETAEHTDMARWEAGEILDENLAWLRAVPPTADIEVGMHGHIHLCHATPQNDMDIVLVDTRIDRWQEVFADLAADVTTVILGHTHMPFQRLVAGRRVINPGSVGMPFGDTGAHWARLREDGSIETRVTYFGVNEALDRLERESGFPNVREWATPYLTGGFTDVQAITTFGPRDGRAPS